MQGLEQFLMLNSVCDVMNSHAEHHTRHHFGWKRTSCYELSSYQTGLVMRPGGTSDDNSLHGCIQAHTHTHTHTHLRRGPLKGALFQTSFYSYLSLSLLDRKSTRLNSSHT